MSYQQGSDGGGQRLRGKNGFTQPAAGERRTSGPMPGAPRTSGSEWSAGGQPGAGQRFSGPLPPDPTAAEASKNARRPSIALPPRPATLAEAGLSASLVQELALKIISNAGVIGATTLAAQMRLPLTGVLDDIFTGLRKEGAIEVAAGATESARASGAVVANGVMSGSALFFRLTEHGKMRA